MGQHQDLVYTFDDWLNDRIIRETYYDGSMIRNDSEMYLKLVMENRMTYDTLNKIQDAQSNTYQLIIDSSVDFLISRYQRQKKNTPFLRKKLEKDIKEIENYFNENQQIYNDVIYPVLHRGIKKGAKYVTAQQYRDVVLKKNKIIAQITVTNDKDERLVVIGRPFTHEWIYCIIEVNIKYLEYLENEYKLLQRATNKPIIESDNEHLTFKANFNYEQLEILCNYINESKLFTIQIDTKTLEAIFNCKLSKPLRTNNNRLLAYLFSTLEDKGHISREWQSIIEKSCLFITSRKGKLCNAQDLATAKSNYLNLGNPKGSTLIDQALKSIKNIKVN